MKKIIKFNQQSIEYELISEKRKTLCIKVKNVKVFVKKPKNMPLKVVEQFILKNFIKITNILEKQKKEIIEENLFEDGKIIKIFGKDFYLKLVKNDYDNLTKISFEDDKFIVYSFKENHQYCDIKNDLETFYKTILNAYLLESFEKFKNITTLSPNKFTIKKMKTCWGSCSSKKNISINLSLIKYEKDVIDYVVLHELCHLKHMNHSSQFWFLVKKYMPNYLDIKKKLKC